MRRFTLDLATSFLVPSDDEDEAYDMVYEHLAHILDDFEITNFSEV
jgi:hypothetical protein